MNNQFNRNQYNNNEEPSLLELKSALQNVYEASMKEEQKSLIILINHLQKILIKKFSENPVQIRPKDYNLSSAIYEKCLKIKNKNE
jgi:hypothetical protein